MLPLLVRDLDAFPRLCRRFKHKLMLQRWRFSADLVQKWLLLQLLVLPELLVGSQLLGYVVEGREELRVGQDLVVVSTFEVRRHCGRYHRQDFRRSLRAEE